MKQDISQTSQAQKRQLPSFIPGHIASIIQQFAKDAKTLLHENLIAEYLFGSYAKNVYTSLSDIDILFLVKTFTPEIRRQLSGLASEYSLEYDVYISPIIKDRSTGMEQQSTVQYVIF